jgi:hypothetical protein
MGVTIFTGCGIGVCAVCSHFSMNWLVGIGRDLGASRRVQVTSRHNSTCSESQRASSATQCQRCIPPKPAGRIHITLRISEPLFIAIFFRFWTLRLDMLLTLEAC